MKTINLNRILSLLTLLVFVSTNLYSQNVAITDDDGYSAESTAMLDIKSTSKGLLVPRMDSLQRVGIVSPATGLLVFDTEANAFYYFDGADWLNLTTNVISPASATVNDVLFSVINTNGDTVFAVYPEGVQINVGDGQGKANKGGFAVGGLASGKQGQDQFLVVSPDSVRVYVDTATTKANKGGFAVGGLASGKGIVTEYLTVSDDSVRIYVSDPDAKANKGGFAVGGLASGKVAATDFMKLTPKNYFIGHESGINTTGLYNTFFGYQSGNSNTTASNNVFMGHLSGFSNEGGGQNVFIGNEAGYSNIIGLQNVHIGYKAGYSNLSNTNIFIGNEAGLNHQNGFGSIIIGDQAGINNNASRNIIIGRFTGDANTTGADNVYIGSSAAGTITDGSNNTFLGVEAGDFAEGGSGDVYIGHRSGYDNNGSYNVVIGDLAGSNSQNYENPSTTFNQNVFIGTSSAYAHTSGDYNVFVGNSSGRNNLTGASNVFLGYQAGYSETGSNKLYIENLNGSSSTALIYGEFDNDLLRFNANIGINSAPNTNYKLSLAPGENDWGIHIDHDHTEAGYTYGIYIDMDNTYSSTSSAYTYGIYTDVRKDNATDENVYGGMFNGHDYQTGTGTRNIYGVYGKAYVNSTNGTSRAYGVYGYAPIGIASTSYAGYFSGNVHITGTLTGGKGAFIIDHPSDPENKYLSHSFVESPDMMNVYNGNIITDKDGYAIVKLPDYFDTLNKDFRYQLTVIGSFAQAIINEKIKDNQFTIQTDKPNIEVSWQVTGIRKDPWALQNPIIVEEIKNPYEKGKYLNPEIYNQPDEMGIHFSEDIKQE